MKNDDVELIRRILDDDDETAFAELVDRYHKPVHALAWRKIGDFHIAEDITQDVFLAIYQRLHTLKDPKLFSGWMYVITTRLCATWIRKNRIKTQPLEETETTMLQKDAYSQHVAEERAKTANQTQRDVVKKLLAKLKESERTVMTLHYLGEMTVEEISRFLGVSAGTIKSRLQRARNRLQKEETMIREALEHFQISPNLTTNIMQEIARLKPGSPTGSKPIMPWAIAASSFVLIILMFGIGSQYLARFQKPYSLEAQAEMTVEIIDAPIVQNIDAKQDDLNQLGNTKAPSVRDANGQRSDEVSLAAADAEGEEASTPKHEWIPSGPMFGSSTHGLLATPEGDLYTYIYADEVKGNIYKLPANGKIWQNISNVASMYDFPPIFQQSIMKWNRTLYFLPASELYESTDDGKTWDLLYAWEEKDQRPIALIFTDATFYIAFYTDVFKSQDLGKTWKSIGDGLTEINALVKVKNTLFAGTEDGFYRLDGNGWKRMKFPEAIKEVYSVATNQERVYVLAEFSGVQLNPGKVARGHERGWGVFGTSNLGNSWLDITPINAWAVNGFIPDAKLVAAGETLIIMGRGRVRSEDGGITWLPPQLADTSPLMDSRRLATVVNTNTIYVESKDGLYRSTDRGKSWSMVNVTPSMDTGDIYNLIVRPGGNKAQNRLPTLYGRMGGDVVRTTDNGKSWMKVPVEISMAKSHREQYPSINRIVETGGVIYASVHYNESGDRVSLYRLSADSRMFVPIQEMPQFDSDHFEPLERTLFRNPSVEHLQDNFSGAAEFFKQLVNADNRTQRHLMQERLDGAFAVSGEIFYLEYNFKLFRWERGNTEWYETEQEETVELSLDIARKDLKLAASGDTVYVGKRDGHLVVSYDKGNNWIDLTPALTLALPFSVNTFKDIVVAGDTVYVATDAGIIITDDGRSWRTITDKDGFNLVMDRLTADGTTLYGIRKNTGIFRLDNGVWKKLVSDIPDRITSLAVEGNTLYVGTDNNGMFHFNLEK